MNAIIALTVFWLSPSTVPAIATMNWQMTIPAAPQMRMVRRPSLSTIQKDRGVEQTLTRVVIREIKNGLLMVPREVKKDVPK